jgi:hypothetical protein
MISMRWRLAGLTRTGIIAQWLPLSTQTDADTRSLVRSFLDVFPSATFWTTELVPGRQEHERTVLLSFYEGGIYAYQGDEGRWQKTMTWVLRKDPDNPYYRWFVGNEKPEPKPQ